MELSQAASEAEATDANAPQCDVHVIMFPHSAFAEARARTDASFSGVEPSGWPKLNHLRLALTIARFLWWAVAVAPLIVEMYTQFAAHTSSGEPAR